VVLLVVVGEATYTTTPIIVSTYFDLLQGGPRRQEQKKAERGYWY